jgi:single-strand DNA-binding protein
LGKHVPHPADKPKETELNIMFNRIILIGRLGQNAEAKTAQNDKEYVVLNIATQESWKNDKGDYESRLAGERDGLHSS